MNNLYGKKLLILGGANTHTKIVKAAKELGVYTIVVDNLKVCDAPAKQIADENYQIDIFDVNSIVKLCKEKNIDGVLSTHLDPGQRPYYLICHELNIPCYIDNWDQVFVLTDKDRFKEVCRENGVDIIPTYTDINSIEYPVLIKPAHSRGSRGQSILYDSVGLKEAIEFAKSESDNKEAIIEKYMGNVNDFTMTYFVKNGEVFLMRTADRLLGEHENHLDRVAMAEVTPSIFNDLYIKKVNKKLVNMIKNLGIKNGPVFIQGFVDGDTVRMYDPGFRFPGTEFDSVFTANLGIDLNKKMICFALTGIIPDDFGDITHGMYKFNCKKGIELWPCVKPGVIFKIDGYDKIIEDRRTISLTKRHFDGEKIGEFYNVNQRLCEIDALCSDVDDLKDFVKMVHSTLTCVNASGDDMIFNRLDVTKIK